MFYLFIFLLIVSFTTFELLNVRFKYQAFLCIVVVVIFILVAGLRYETGVDWFNYSKMFEDTSALNNITNSYDRLVIFSSLDYGYNIFISLIKYLNGSIQTIFFIVSCVSSFLVYKSVKLYSQGPIISLLLYYSSLFFILDMSGIRQGLSLSIFLYSIQYIYKKEFFKFMLLIILAASFHWSAYFLLPLYFFFKTRYKTGSLVTFFLASVVIFLIKISWLATAIASIIPLVYEGALASRIRFYTTFSSFAVERSFSNNTIITIVFYIITFATLMYFRRHLEKANQYFNLFLNVYICQIFAFFCLYEFIEMADRLRLYFMVANLIILPGIIFLFASKTERVLAFFCVGVFAFFSCMPWVLNAPTTIAYHPYQNYIVHKIFNISSTGLERLRKHGEIHR